MTVFGSKDYIVKVVSGHPGYPVAFPDPQNRHQGYAYAWTLSTAPELGTWAVVPGEGKPWLGGIVHVQRASKRDLVGLKNAIRAATNEDVEKDIARRRR